jgi:hypothetical protein
MKRIRQWGTVAAVSVTVGAGVVLYAVPSQAETDLRLTATQKTSLFAIPCGDCVLHSQPQGAHIGGTEYDAGVITEHGAKVGSFVLEATGLTPFVDGAGRVQLVGTIVIGHSQLTFQGVEDPPLQGGVAAITGGTGRFRAARGQITYTDTSETVTRLDVQLD